MFADKTVLVTGASSGIGEALARRFARGGARLVLVARREDRLRALADELRDVAANQKGPGPSRPNRTPKVIAADLLEDGACDRVVSEAISAVGPVDVLVNNAGVGEFGDFAGKDLSATERMMRLNMAALVRLTHRVLPDMLSRRRGWIMNIASAAAFQPLPYLGVYAATKSFVLSFSMGLWEEVRRHGVVVTCVCPGTVRTEFMDHGGFEARREEFMSSKLSMDAAAVADAAYSALSRRRPVVVPGRLAAFGAMVGRHMPMKWVTKLTGKVLGPKESGE